MKCYASVFLIVFGLTGTALAQPTIFDPSNVKWDNVKTAQTLSNIGVGVGIGLDVVDLLRSEDRKHSSIVLVERYGIVLLVTEISKRVVHRTRPDKSDNKSWPSEHTAFASGRWYIGIPVGYLRMAGDKHFLTDVVSGFVIRKVTNHFVK